MAREAAKTPKPGKPVRGSRSGRPVMAAIDLIGQRWILRIVWELSEGPLSFRALQKACDGISPSVLNQRLTELREVKLVESRFEEGYALTRLGVELLAKLQPLQKWSDKWARAIQT